MPEHCDHYHDKIEQLLQSAAANEQEHTSFRRRLKELDDRIEKQNEILITLERLGNAIENMTKSLSRIETTIATVGDRVKKLETEPGDKWRKLSFEIVKYIVLAAAGVAVGCVLKG